MAGIAGMSSPGKVPAMVSAPEPIPQAPDIAGATMQDAMTPPEQQAPAAQSQPFDYDAWAQQQVAGASNSVAAPNDPNFDYDKWAHEQVNGDQAPADPKDANPSFLKSAADTALMASGLGTTDALSKAARVAQKAGEIIDQVTLGPIRGAANAVMDGKSAIGGALEGLMGHDKTTTAELIEKASPTIKNLPPLTVDIMNGVFTTNPTPKEKAEGNTVSAAQALGLATDFAVGAGEMKAISKAPGFMKLATTALGDWADSSRAADVLAAESSVLSPAKQAALAATSAESTAAELQKIDANLKFTPNNLDVTNAHELDIGHSLRSNAQYKAALIKQGDTTVDALNKISEGFANIEPKAGGAKSVFDTLSDADGANGRILGKYKSLARDAAQDQLFTPDTFKSKLSDIMEQAGFTPGNRPTTESVSVALNIPQDEARDLIPRISSYFNKSQGQMSYAELENFHNNLAVASKAAQRDSYPVQKLFGDLRKAAGDDLANVTGTVLEKTNPEISKTYAQARTDYSSVLQSQDKISSLLKNDAVTQHALVKYVTSGAGDKNKIEAVVNILNKQNPELVRDLNGAIFNDIMVSNARTPTAANPFAYDFNGIKKDFKKLIGSDGGVLNTITGSPEKTKDVMTLVDQLERLQIANSKGLEAPISETFLGRTFYNLSKIGSPKEMVASMIQSMDRDKNIARYMNAMGIENMSKVVPVKDRAQFVNYLRSVSQVMQDRGEQKLKQTVGK